MTIGRMETSLVRGSIGALALALMLGDLGAPAPLAAQGRVRELGCRGGPGLSLRVETDPSPRDTTYVVARVDYRASAKAVGYDYRALDPGTCTWNPARAAGYPAEPGNVRFDLKRTGQPWPAKDTSIKAGAFFPDPVSLPRYLGDSRHYYVFYVNDSSRFSVSFGPMHETARPVFVMTNGSTTVDPSTRREILCRGGAGLVFPRSATVVGPNQESVTMSYYMSANVPGPSGSGLSPGSCAWTDRNGVPKEPGKVTFITASNAQLKQIQSGSAVDRSPTAAVRYPDVRTIPAYLVDPARYWSFFVTVGAPDKAASHGAWIPPVNVATTLGEARSRPGATTVTRPTTGVGSSVYTPGAGNVTVTRPAPTGTGSSVYEPGTGSATATSRVETLFDIRNVTVTPGLEGVVIRFEAAANSKPTVALTPVGGGAPVQLTVSGTPISSGMARYVAASQAKLPRHSNFNYVVSASATAQARANQATGSFKTLGQYLTVFISQIYILSDGDKEGSGEMYLYLESCPSSALTYDSYTGVNQSGMNWSEGPQRIYAELKSLTGNTPDQVRIVPWIWEDDFDAGVPFENRRARPVFSCTSPTSVDPGGNEGGEWNSLVMDIDLTKYPGAKAGDSFVRRSKPLAGGSTVSFEIRGSFLITRN